MSTKRIKQYLLLVTAVGVVAVAASGAGTFATFNAEVSNNGNTFTAGTLFLHDTNGTNTCSSEEGTANTTNVNNGSSFTDTTNGCSILFTVNVGKATLSTTLGASESGTVSQITVASLNGLTLHAGDVLQIAEAGQPGDTVVVSQDVSSGTTVNVLSEALAGTYTTAATVTQVDTTHYATLALNNAGSLNASDIKFEVPGCTSSHPQSETVGTIASGSYSAPNTSFTLAANSPYTIDAGQNVTIGGNVYQLVTALTKGTTGPVEVNAGSDVSSDSGSIGWEPTFSSSTNFCSDAVLSIAETDSNFDLSGSTPATCVSAATHASTPFSCEFADASSLSNLNSFSALSLVSGGGSSNTGTDLSASGTRYFLIGIQLPGSTDNTYQNQEATFGLRWHIDAA